LEVLGGDRPVILALDDLHWSDHSTVELISMLGTRPEPARLLVLCAYRRADLAKSHPLTKVIGELGAHRQATMLSLGPITSAATDQYLNWRFPQHAFPEGLGPAIHRTTGGNPLFMVALLDELEGHDLLVREGDHFKLAGSIDDVTASRPESVKQLLDTQLEQLGLAEQRVLEAASIAGDVFSAEIVAEALEMPFDAVDDACERLAQPGRFLRHLGTKPWPDGTMQNLYGFVHVLYRHAALARVQSAARRHWHIRISERLEAAYGGNALSIAVELAAHFEEGRNLAKAAK
jgi:predicted ATPase